MSQFDLRRVKRCITHGAKRRQLRCRYNKQRNVLVDLATFLLSQRHKTYIVLRCRKTQLTHTHSLLHAR